MSKCTVVISALSSPHSASNWPPPAVRRHGGARPPSRRILCAGSRAASIPAHHQGDVGLGEGPETSTRRAPASSGRPGKAARAGKPGTFQSPTSDAGQVQQRQSATRRERATARSPMRSHALHPPRPPAARGHEHLLYWNRIGRRPFPAGRDVASAATRSRSWASRPLQPGPRATDPPDAPKPVDRQNLDGHGTRLRAGASEDAPRANEVQGPLPPLALAALMMSAASRVGTGDGSSLTGRPRVTTNHWGASRLATESGRILL